MRKLWLLRGGHIRRRTQAVSTSPFSGNSAQDLCTDCTTLQCRQATGALCLLRKVILSYADVQCTQEQMPSTELLPSVQAAGLSSRCCCWESRAILRAQAPKWATLLAHHVLPWNLVLPLPLGQEAFCTATAECLLLPSQVTVCCPLFF